MEVVCALRSVTKVQDLREEAEDDSMATWDDAKLKEVVAKKDKRRGNQTDIICKFFLQAIENKK